MMNKSIPTIQNLPFTPEAQKKYNGGNNSATFMTFSNHTIIKFLVPCIKKNDCNVVSFDIGRMITNEDFESLNSYITDNTTTTCMQGATYGFDLFNLSRNKLSAEDFIIFSNQIAEALLNILNQDIKLYQSENYMFSDGFTVP